MGGWDFGTQLEARANIFAVFFGARRKTACLLMVVGGFGPGDLVTSVLGFVQEGNGNWLQARTQLAKNAECRLECKLNLGRENIKKKFFWQTQTKFATR